MPDQAPAAAVLLDDFDAPALDLEWNTLRTRGDERMSLAARPGHLRLALGRTRPTEPGPLSFVGRRLPSMRSRSQARRALSATSVAADRPVELAMQFDGFSVVLEARAGPGETWSRVAIADGTGHADFDHFELSVPAVSGADRPVRS